MIYKGINIILTEKEWNSNLVEKLSVKVPSIKWVLISDKKEFTVETLAKISPDFVFIPHWSYIIPKEIYENYECVVFHMTDLPYGRGGSPLQNLIVRGKKATKISALKVGAGIDTGDIYLKKELSLEGTAKEIFERSSIVIEEMIEEIIDKNLNPIPQQGEEVKFKRRKPEQSDISNLKSLNKVYDYIRMLDCPGYPKAFLKTENLRFEFDSAILKGEEIIANVRITTK